MDRQICLMSDHGYAHETHRHSVTFKISKWLVLIQENSYFMFAFFFKNGEFFLLLSKRCPETWSLTEEQAV